MTHDPICCRLGFGYNDGMPGIAGGDQWGGSGAQEDWQLRRDWQQDDAFTNNFQSVNTAAAPQSSGESNSF